MTRTDADSARDAGAVCLGFTCGGMNDEKALRAAGMRKVYRDPADMAAHLEQAIAISSPGSAILTAAGVESLMRAALLVAREGLDRGEAPIGCVIALGDGTIIAKGHIESNASYSKIAHAEIVAFARAAGKVPPDARDLVLVSSLEQCVMCLGAAMEAAVDTVIYSVPAPTDGGRLRVRPPVSPESQMPRLLGGVLCDESRDLFRAFLRQQPRDSLQAQFVRQLLDAP